MLGDAGGGGWRRGLGGGGGDRARVILAYFVVCVQVKLVREGAVEKTFVDKKPQGVCKQVKQYLEDYGTEKEKEAAKSWSVIKLYYKFGLSNQEVSTMRRCLSSPSALWISSPLSLVRVHVCATNPSGCADVGAASHGRPVGGQ